MPVREIYNGEGFLYYIYYAFNRTCCAILESVCQTQNALILFSFSTTSIILYLSIQYLSIISIIIQNGAYAATMLIDYSICSCRSNHNNLRSGTVHNPLFTRGAHYSQYWGSTIILFQLIIHHASK